MSAIRERPIRIRTVVLSVVVLALVITSVNLFIGSGEVGRLGILTGGEGGSGGTTASGGGGRSRHKGNRSRSHPQPTHQLKKEDISTSVDGSEVELTEDEEALMHHQAAFPDDTLEHILQKRCSTSEGQQDAAPTAPGIRNRCNPRACKLCRGFLADTNTTSADGIPSLPTETTDYLRKHVLFSIITGSFDKFLRLELAYCTWLQHVPHENLYLMTDKKGGGGDESVEEGRGRWVEGALPESISFTPAQLSAKGYTINWIKAQYRFLEGLQIMANRSGAGGGATLDGSGEDIRWIAVVDDDTFVNLNSLVAFFKRLDVSKAGSPVYVGDRGWGGAGHFFNAKGAEIVKDKLHSQCTMPHMIKKFRASDETLKKCVPSMGIQVINDRLFSHCQANYLKGKLIRGDHISAHVKRDVVLPLRLAIFRMRLYYQVVYERNVTCAFHLLMHFGSCAYGSSCKISSCDTLHDRHAILDFNSLVQDDPRWEADGDASSDEEGDVVVGQSASTKWWVVPRL